MEIFIKGHPSSKDIIRY